MRSSRRIRGAARRNARARCPIWSSPPSFGGYPGRGPAGAGARPGARVVAPYDAKSAGRRRRGFGSVARPLRIVLPEDHDGHHRNPDIEFGDIFRFYDAPARALLARLAPTSRRTRNAAGRSDPREDAGSSLTGERMTKRALFLISDTGGGHRSAANAITAALDEIKDPYAFEHRIEDVAAHCSFPLTQLGLGYSMALRYAPPVYGALYYATNGRRRYQGARSFLRAALSRTPARPVLELSTRRHRIGASAAQSRGAARSRRRPHAARSDRHGHYRPWQSARIVAGARCRCRRRARPRGVRARALARRLARPPADARASDSPQIRRRHRNQSRTARPARAARRRTHRDADGRRRRRRQTVARRRWPWRRARLPVHLVVVCGRNEPLKQKLDEDVAGAAHADDVLGFTDKIPEYFRAADLLVTKAGPGTLAEANAAQLPSSCTTTFQDRSAATSISSATTGSATVAIRQRFTSRASRPRHDPHARAPRGDPPQPRNRRPERSSRRIAALIAQIVETGTIPPQEEIVARPLQAVASL